LILRAGGRGHGMRLGSTAPPVGAFHDAVFVPDAVRFTPGDILLLYTDGITEARSGQEFFGIERLEDALDRAISALLIVKRIASGYEKIGENDRASEHYHAAGDLEAQAGRAPKAIEDYRKKQAGVRK
jgi:serine phosphatase RsbU (regulator of sigma subunit)